MKKNVFLKKLSCSCMFYLIFWLVFSTSALATDKLPTTTNKANLEKAVSVEVTPPQETYPIMRPDSETRTRWIRDFESAPKATIDRELMETMAPQAAMSLLSRLQYTPNERNQQSCGNCWIWAGTGVMGIDLDVNWAVHDRLSTQYPNSCIISGGYPCCGGWLSDLADFYTTNKQALPWANTNADWVDGGTTCATGTSGRVCGTISTTPDYGIVSIDDASITTHTVGEATAIANIKNILAQNKGVWFAFFLPDDTAWNSFFSFWNTQNENVIWDFDPYHGIPYNPVTGGGHAVLCVGFNDDDPNPNNHYWIMLNSWGAPALRTNGLFRVKMHMNYDNDRITYYNLYWQTLNMTWDAPPPPLTCNLWNQPLSAVNNGAYANQDFETTMDTLDIFIADDFRNEVPWSIDTLFFPGGLWSGGTSLAQANSLHFEIYRDAAGQPDGDSRGGGNPPVWSLSLPPTDSQVTLSTDSGGNPGNITLQLDTPIQLAPNTYWLVFYPQMDFATGGQYGRQVSDTTDLSVAKVMNPGAGFLFPTTWTDVTDASTFGLTQQDFAFCLQGRENDFYWPMFVPAITKGDK